MKSDLTKYLNMMQILTGLKDAESSFIKKSLSFHRDDGLPENYGEYVLTKEDKLKYGSIGAVICAAIAYAFYRSIIVFILLLPAGILVYPKSKITELKSKRQSRLTEEFTEGMLSVGSFLGAGLSLENAFISAYREQCRINGKDALMSREFENFIKNIRLNKSIEAILKEFAERSMVDDIKSFSEVFIIAKRKGGRMKEIIENTASIIRDKRAVNEEILNMTASRRYEQNIMNILPFVIIIYIDLTSDGFIDIMYGCFAGRVIMTVSLILTGVSYMLSQKILDIKV